MERLAKLLESLGYRVTVLGGEIVMEGPMGVAYRIKPSVEMQFEGVEKYWLAGGGMLPGNSGRIHVDGVEVIVGESVCSDPLEECIEATGSPRLPPGQVLDPVVVAAGAVGGDVFVSSSRVWGSFIVASVGDRGIFSFFVYDETTLLYAYVPAVSVTERELEEIAEELKEEEGVANAYVVRYDNVYAVTVSPDRADLVSIVKRLAELLPDQGNVKPFLYAAAHARGRDLPRGLVAKAASMLEGRGNRILCCGVDVTKIATSWAAPAVVASDPGLLVQAVRRRYLRIIFDAYSDIVDVWDDLRNFLHRRPRSLEGGVALAVVAYELSKSSYSSLLKETP